MGQFEISIFGYYSLNILSKKFPKIAIKTILVLA